MSPPGFARRLATGLLVLGAFLLPTTGCAAVFGNDLPETATVTYDFRDGSVDWPYHRSFVLTFDHERARIVVRDYTDVLADRTAPMPGDVWNTVAGTFGTVRNLKVDWSLIETGCVGGSGFTLSVKAGVIKSFSKHAEVCGGANDNPRQRVREWIAPVLALFPPMEELAPVHRS